MKKLFAFLLAGVMAFSMMACGKETEQTPMPADMASMTAPIDALARCMLENHMTYDPADPEFFWTSLFYFTGAYGMNHELVEETERYELNVPAQVMQEHATVLFSEYEELIELPVIMEGNIFYDTETDAYLVSRGDIGLSEMKLTSFAETENGYAVTAELWSTGSEKERIGTWDVTLVDNAYANGMENPLYLYSVSSMIMQDAQETITPDETTTAIFNGLSDSHTAELTLTDGSVQAFQFDAESEAGKLLSSLKEGDGVTIGYITDAATGAAKIVSAE